ncbi:MAG: hypothetical protein CVT68_01555 [Actinobacteria bacterium HGW-Actinobacteria-8]|nr:MAG: hypothetical protein CVT68_01555 [Actinobacteria bacterium HGW-Actinobacteria-8]
MSEEQGWVVVTGAASGIGLAVAEKVQQRGHSVVLVDLDGEGLSLAARRFASDSSTTIAQVVGDVGDPATMENAVAQVPAAHRLVGWVNSAGVNVPGSVADTDVSRLRHGMRANFEGTFWGSKAAAGRMLEQGGGGSIVNMTSTAALVGYPGNAVYAAAKGAVISLTKQVAAEYAEHKIRCNAVAPGVIDTPMNQSILEGNPEREALLERWLRLSPLGRLGRPEEVAAMTVFLLGADGAFTTGQTFVVDGGQLAIGRLS